MAIKIPLRGKKYAGLFALVDDADLPVVSRYKWFPVKVKHVGKFYAVANIRKPDGCWTQVSMHRLLAGKDGFDVDHRDRDGLDNRRENLRTATRAQNVRNAGAHSDNRTGFRGVCHDRHRGKFMARLYHAGRTRFLGYFESAEDAASAYDAEAKKVFGEFAFANFPEKEAA